MRRDNASFDAPCTILHSHAARDVSGPPRAVTTVHMVVIWHEWAWQAQRCAAGAARAGCAAALEGRAAAVAGRWATGRRGPRRRDARDDPDMT